MKVLTQTTNNKLKLLIMVKKEVKIGGKPISKCSYQEIKKAAAEAGQSVIGKTLEEMKKHLESQAGKGEGKPTKQKESKPQTESGNGQGEEGEGEAKNPNKVKVITTNSKGERQERVINTMTTEEIINSDLKKNVKAHLLNKMSGMKAKEIAPLVDMLPSNVNRAIWMHKTGTGIKETIKIKTNE